MNWCIFIQNNLPNLKYLTLNIKKTSYNSLDDNGVICLNNMLSKLVNLCSLDLNFNYRNKYVSD